LNPLEAISAASKKPQTLTATRTLPYASHPIYAIISDVPSYSSFLPYCQSSTVTRWSAPDSKHQRKWPSEAKIVVGFKGFTEEFTSKIFCVPGSIVESVGGGAKTGLEEASIRHHLDSEAGAAGEREDDDAAAGLLTHLQSRWTLEPLAEDKTEVSLSLEYAFANPMYTTLSAGAAPKVAESMIRAFEERVRTLLDKNPDMAKASLGQIDRGEATR
jgi:coenzyme Q-binding protein COQ10